jgi:hypothetical protein
MALGVLLVAVYAFQRIASVVDPALATELSGPIFEVLRAAGLLLAVAGAMVPAVGWLRSTWQANRSLHALRPLWETMRSAFPEVILFTTRRAVLERFGVDDVHLRLYRRVIEVRDGMLALRDHLPPDAIAQAHTFLAQRDSPALAEACGIELALHRFRSGEAAEPGPARWASVGPDLADEVTWLRAVSAGLRSPEPTAFVTWWSRAEMSTVDELR